MIGPKLDLEAQNVKHSTKMQVRNWICQVQNWTGQVQKLACLIQFWTWAIQLLHFTPQLKWHI